VASVTLDHSEADLDHHFVLRRGAKTMIAETPSSLCTVGATGYRRKQMNDARRVARVCSRARVVGVAFFDYNHGQTGVAPNVGWRSVQWSDSPGQSPPAASFDLRAPGAQTCSVAGLEQIGADVERALERVSVPAYVIDRHGVIRWINAAAERLVGDVRGKQMTTPLAPEERRRGREVFARNLLGPPGGSDNRAVLLNAEGERFTAELSAVPLANGEQVIGVFGEFKHVEEESPL
jgi:PAS domain S-box-containing protein